MSHLPLRLLVCAYMAGFVASWFVLCWREADMPKSQRMDSVFFALAVFFWPLLIPLILIKLVDSGIEKLRDLTASWLSRR